MAAEAAIHDKLQPYGVEGKIQLVRRVGRASSLRLRPVVVDGRLRGHDEKEEIF